jgi:hypothetical protein
LPATVAGCGAEESGEAARGEARQAVNAAARAIGKKRMDFIGQFSECSDRRIYPHL